jgi:uncharacterized protein with PIN domain
MPWLPDERIPPDCPLCGGTIRIVRRAPVEERVEVPSTSRSPRSDPDPYVTRCDDCRNKWQWEPTDPYRVTKM